MIKQFLTEHWIAISLVCILFIVIGGQSMIKKALLIAPLLLVGCSVPLPKGFFVETGGALQHRSGASDWVLFDGNGKRRDWIGQVTAVAGYNKGGLDVYGGFGHLSLPEYGHDKGVNGVIIGTRYRWQN